ncbi:MAG: hypothetical protein ACK55Z_09140 [bacterium]
MERDLDRTPSTYIKCRENPDSAERCPSEAQRSSKYSDVRTWSSLNITLTPYHISKRTRRDSHNIKLLYHDSRTFHVTYEYVVNLYT